MSTRNDRFNRSMRSLEEFIDSFEDPSKIAAFSDRGTGVPPVQQDACNRQDAPCPSDSRQAKLQAAIMRLRRAGRGYLVPVLRLIVRNGKFNDESVAEMVSGKHGKKALKTARRQYERHRKALLKIV